MLHILVHWLNLTGSGQDSVVDICENYSEFFSSVPGEGLLANWITINIVKKSMPFVTDVDVSFYPKRDSRYAKLI
jgi:hypothetical protein